MAKYRVWHGGDGTAPTTTDWTKAYATFGAAVTAATSPGDVIIVHKAHQEELAVNTTYTFANTVSVLTVDKDASDAISTMGETGWIGNSTTARTVTLTGAQKVMVYGLTFRGHGSSANVSLNLADGGQFTLEACKVWYSSTSTSSYLSLGASNTNCWTRLVNCEIKNARTSNGSWSILVGGRVEMCGGSIIAASTSTSAVFIEAGANNAGTNLLVDGVDLSGVQASQTLVGSMTRGWTEVRFVRCKLPATATVMATQTPANLSSGHVWVHDCATGDTHGKFGYYNALGSVESNSSIYYTTGAAAQSWKITTTANASFESPFITPSVDWYHSGTSAITPRLEILRDDSATAYTAAQVWVERMAKATSGSTIATFATGRQSLTDWHAGTTASDNAAGDGLGSWTGESGTAWSGKLDCGSVTPAEAGDLSMRVCVGLASIAGSLYVDPQIRT